MSQSDTDSLTEAQRAEIREIIRNEQSDNMPITRRDALKGGAFAAALAGLGGGAAGSAAADTGGTGAQLSVGSVTSNTYDRNDGEYGGPDSAKSELVSELGSSDAGAKYLAEDTGAQYHWTGSQWELMPAERKSVNTKVLNNAHRYPDPADDLQGIINAMNNLPASGGTIHLQEGTYVFEGTYSDGPLWQIDKPLRVTGEGGASVLEWDPTTQSGSEGVKMIEVGVGGSDPQAAAGTRFESFKIDSRYQDASNSIDNSVDGHNIGVFSDDFKMISTTSVNSTGDGVEPFQNATDPVIIGNTLRDNQEQHVHLNGCTGGKVIANTMEGGNNNALISTFAADGKTTEDCIIANNTLRGGSTTGINVNPGDGSVTGIDIIGNRFINLNKRAVNSVLASGSDAVPSEITIKNNVMKDVATEQTTRGAAIHFTSGEDVTISNNDIHRPRHSGVYLFASEAANSTALTDFRVLDNTVVDPAFNTTNSPSGFELDGITLDEAGETMSHIEVRENKIIAKSADSDLEHGIHSQASGSGIVVTGNRIRGQTGGSAIQYFRLPDFHRHNEPATPVDVRSLKSEAGNQSYHDGTNSNTVGPAVYDGSASAWVSLVDGSTIS